MNLGLAKYPRWVYKAVRYTGWGLTDDNRLVTGLVIVPHSLPDPDEFPNYIDDTLREELLAAGLDSDIRLPKNGLVEGELYEVTFQGADEDTVMALIPYKVPA